MNELDAVAQWLMGYYSKKLLEYNKIDGFKSWLKTLGYAKTTVYNLPRHVSEFLIWAKNANVKSVKDTNPKLINDYFLYLHHKSNKRRGGGLSLSYINKHRQALKKYSEYLFKVHGVLLPVNVKTLVVEENHITVLSRKEINHLYELAHRHPLLKYRDILMLDIYYGCGLRRSEGVGIDLSDIDKNKRRLLVRHGKGNKERIVPFASSMLIHLKNYEDNYRVWRLKNGDEKALFVSEWGNRILSQSLYNRLKKLQEQSELQSLRNKTIGLHTLRHSIATHLLQSGMNLEHIRRFLGHESLESTQIYLHLLPSALPQAGSLKQTSL